MLSLRSKEQVDFGMGTPHTLGILPVVAIQRTIKEAIGILGLALVMGVGNFLLNPKAKGVFQRTQRAFDRPVLTHLPDPRSPADTTAFVALQVAVELIRQRGALVASADPVDALRTLDPRDPEGWVPALLALNPDTPWVITDTAAFRHRAWRLARLLRSLGFQRVWVTVAPADQLVRGLKREKP